MSVAGRGYFAVDRQRLRQLIDELGGTDAHLLLVLAIEADPDTAAIRGNLRELAELCGVSPKRMRVVLPHLEAAGYLTFHRGVNGEDRGAGRVSIAAITALDARPRTAPKSVGVNPSTAPTPRPHRAHTSPLSGAVPRGNAHKTEDSRQQTGDYVTPRDASLDELGTIEPLEEPVVDPYNVTEETDMDTPLPLAELTLAPVTDDGLEYHEPRAGTFEVFWHRWPNKRGKQDAAKAWRTATRMTSPATILAGLDRLIAELADDHTRGYCPYPATWLRRGSWDDELRPPRQGDQTEHARQVAVTRSRAVEAFTRLSAPTSRELGA